MPFLIALLMLGPVNLEDLECYDSPAHYVYALTEGRMLWSCTGEHLILILDENGDVRHRYDKRGQGPEELEYPTVLGVTPERIYISSETRVQTFDHQLKLIPNSLPPLHILNLGGEYLGDNRFLLNPIFHDKTGIRVIEPGKDSWQVTATFLPTPWELPKQPTRTFSYRHTVRGANGYFFYGRDVDKVKIRGDYQIEVYRLDKQEQPEMIQMLSARLDGFPEWGQGKAFASLAARVDKHYVVLVNFAVTRPYKGLATYLDFFNQLGELVHRRKFPGGRVMTSVHGKPDAYLIDGDELIATPISSYLAEFLKGHGD